MSLVLRHQNGMIDSRQRTARIIPHNANLRRNLIRTAESHPVHHTRKQVGVLLHHTRCATTKGLVNPRRQRRRKSEPLQKGHHLAV